VEFVDRFKGQRSRSHRLTSANAVKVVGETSSRVRHVDQKHVQNPHRRPQINITTTNQWIAGNARRFSNAFRVPVYHTDHAHCLEMNARLSGYGQNVPETGETAECPISATPPSCSPFSVSAATQTFLHTFPILSVPPVFLYSTVSIDFRLFSEKRVS